MTRSTSPSSIPVKAIATARLGMLQDILSAQIPRAPILSGRTCAGKM